MNFSHCRRQRQVRLPCGLMLVQVRMDLASAIRTMHLIFITNVPNIYEDNMQILQ